MFGTINILGMGTFSLLIPETKGRSLEDMDIIFGAVDAAQRRADVDRFERELAGHDADERRSDADEKV